MAITSLALSGITELYLIGKGLRLVTTPRDEIDLLKHSGINRLTIGLTLIIDVYMRVVLLVVFYLVSIKASQEIFRLKLTIVSILLSMFVRQLAFILSAESIPEILRRASGPPHWSFLVIGIGELVAFVLAANAIINWESDATIRVDGLIAILKGLIFGYVPDLLGYLFIFQFPPSYMVLISLIAIVLGYNIINSLLNFKLFKRHDVDYLIIARSNLAEGNYVNALAVLEQVKHHTISWYCIRSVCFLGLFQFGDAWSTLLHAPIEVISSYGNALNDEEMLLILSNMCAANNFSYDSKAELLNYALSKNVRDPVIAHFILVLFRELTRFEDSEEDSSFVSKLLENDGFPLSRIVTNIFGDEIEEAKDSIVSYRPNSRIDSIVYVRLGLEAEITPKPVNRVESKLKIAKAERIYLYRHELMEETNCGAVESIIEYQTVKYILDCAIEYDTTPDHQQAWRHLLRRISRRESIISNAVFRELLQGELRG